MKIGLFADPHYSTAEVLCGTRRPRLSLEKMKEAFSVFRKEKTDFVVCLGDFTDRCEREGEAEDCLEEILALIRASVLPFYLVPGNHDYLDFSGKTLESALGHAMPPFTVDTESCRFLFLDASYRSDMRRFDEAGVEWTDANLPPEQVSFLKETLSSPEKPCIVLLHENLDPSVEVHHIVKNADEIREILEKSGKVSLVIQGHYHPGADHTVNGIRYLTLPAMCEGTGNRFAILETEGNIAHIRLLQSENVLDQ